MPRQMLQTALLLAALLILPACPSGLSGGDLSKRDKIIEMKKGPCYGRCPVFTLTVYEGGAVAYEGEQNTNRMGLHIKYLGQTEFADLKKKVEEVNLWEYKNVYKGSYPDLQTVTLTQFYDGQSRSVTGKDGRPPAIMELESILDQIANGMDGWTKKGDPTYGLPDSFILDELIVQLAGGVDVNRWKYRFRAQSLEPVKEISKGRNYWLLKFDPESIDPPRMLQKVRGDRDVVGAEFNKKGEVRN